MIKTIKLASKKDKFRVPYGISCKFENWVESPEGWRFTEIDATLRLMLGDVEDYPWHYRIKRLFRETQ